MHGRFVSSGSSSKGNSAGTARRSLGNSWTDEHFGLSRLLGQHCLNGVLRRAQSWQPCFSQSQWAAFLPSYADGSGSEPVSRPKLRTTQSRSGPNRWISLYRLQRVSGDTPAGTNTSSAARPSPSTGKEFRAEKL